MTVTSAFTTRKPRRCTSSTARRSSSIESASLNRASVSGKWLPMSPSAAAPSSASVMACSSTSASEWPSRPSVWSICTPPITSLRPGTRACTSQPSPILKFIAASPFPAQLLLVARQNTVRLPAGAAWPPGRLRNASSQSSPRLGEGQAPGVVDGWPAPATAAGDCAPGEASAVPLSDTYSRPSASKTG